MKRVVFAFGVGLGMGLAVAGFRMLQRAKAGFSTPAGSHAGSRGPKVSSTGSSSPGDVVAGVAERLRSALDEGRRAARETEEELRGKVLDGGR